MTDQQKDAERYRFLRDVFAIDAEDDFSEFGKLANLAGASFDECIDAAIKDRQEKLKLKKQEVTA